MGMPSKILDLFFFFYFSVLSPGILIIYKRDKREIRCLDLDKKNIIRKRLDGALDGKPKSEAYSPSRCAPSSTASHFF